MKEPTYLRPLRWLSVCTFLLGVIVYRFGEGYFARHLPFGWTVFLSSVVSVGLISVLLLLIFRKIYGEIRTLARSQEEHQEATALLEKSRKELEEKNAIITQKINELRILDRISKAIASTMDLDRILNIILEGVTKHLGFDRAIICLVNQKGGLIEGRQGVGISPDLVRRLKVSLDEEDNPIVKTVREGRPFIIARVSENGKCLQEPVSRQVKRIGGGYASETQTQLAVSRKEVGLREEPAYAEIFACLGGRENVLASVPLTAKDKVNGVLLVDHLYSARPIQEADIRSLVTFTNQAGLAIENARLYDTEKRFNEELRRQVELAKKELKEAQAQIIRAERLAAMGEMCVVVAHEVRNPMSSIRGCAQRIYNAVADTDPNKKYTKYIMQEVDRLERIVKDMLTVTRQPKPNLVKENINKIIEEIIVHMSDEIKNSGVKLIKELDSKLPYVFVDPALIEQIIFNIVQNAIFFMQGRERKELKISTGQSKKYLQVKISDTGCGIPLGNRKKIFDPFFTTKPQGTGLGLAICQRIVEAHNGRIDVESEVGEGATFIVNLPLSE